LTQHTVTRLSLAPAGTNEYGPNQTANDPDGTVDHDERLRLTGIRSGRYDSKLEDKTGRVCVVTNLDIKPGAIVAIEESQLTHCRK
jgi:hypothetical protein